jgi:PKD domain/Bacterial Ig-like domain (group 1)
MLMVSMISRLRRWSVLAALICVATLVSVACEKVPLLAPSGSSITLTALATALPPNGTTTIVAQVIEAAGTPPHSGTRVTFTTNLGTVQPPEAETDISGRVAVRYVAGSGSGTATITAISGGVSASGLNAVKIAVGTAAVGRVAVNASPTLIPSLGGSSLISATVFDINGTQLAGVPVSFTTTSGSLDSVLATTDGNGVATSTLRTSSTATVTATIGGTSGGSTTTPPPTTGTPATGTTSPTSGSVTVNIAGVPALTITPPATAPSAGISSSYTFAVTAAATNGSAIKDLLINWGDGQTQDLGAVTGSSVVAHVYASPGTYNITATLTDAAGAVVTVSSAVTVNPKPQPAVSITAPTTTPTAGTDTAFTASVAAPTGTGSVITSVSIDYGDGTKQDLGPATGTSISLHHVYQNGGTYTVTLTARDSNGASGTAVTSVFVQTSTPLTVLLSATATPAGANTTESFTATVLGLGNSVVSNYHWVFGGANGSADTTTNQVTRSYVAGSGPFTVTVTVTTSTGLQATGSTVITP